MVIAGADADPEIVALDLLAQAEHGPDSPVALIALDERVLSSVVAAVEQMAPQRPSVTEAELQVLRADDPGSLAGGRGVCPRAPSAGRSGG